MKQVQNASTRNSHMSYLPWPHIYHGKEEKTRYSLFLRSIYKSYSSDICAMRGDYMPRLSYISVQNGNNIKTHIHFYRTSQ